MNLFKKLFIPSGEQKELTAFENWTVRWESRYDKYSHHVRPEVEVFTNEEEANTFAQALKDAFKLIKHTSGNTVKVEKTK